MGLSNYVKIFKALSNEQRLKIFIVIYKDCRSKGGKGSAEFPVEDNACCPVAGVIEKAFTKVCKQLDYKAKETPKGIQVEISAKDPSKIESLKTLIKALHDFCGCS